MRFLVAVERDDDLCFIECIKWVLWNKWMLSCMLYWDIANLLRIGAILKGLILFTCLSWLKRWISMRYQKRKSSQNKELSFSPVLYWNFSGVSQISMIRSSNDQYLRVATSLSFALTFLLSNITSFIWRMSFWFH